MPEAGMSLEPNTVPCKWCGKLTTATALAECAACWHVRMMADAEPQLVLRILLDREKEMP